jgi:hypothetical protein
MTGSVDVALKTPNQKERSGTARKSRAASLLGFKKGPADILRSYARAGSVTNHLHSNPKILNSKQISNDQKAENFAATAHS